MSPFNKALTEPMQKVAKSLQENGLSTFVRWNWIFCAPPLIITKEQIQEGINIIDKAVDEADKFYQE
jgi:taurine--2-oxoglutarate transaminase